jgi:hypothetical protein
MAVSFKTFVMEICDAAAAASESLSNRSVQLLNTFFTHPSGDASSSDNDKYVPKTVLLEAPVVDEKGEMTKADVEIPLLSLASPSSSKVEKLTFKIDLLAFVDNDELKVELTENKTHKGNSGCGTLEITLSPSESAEGLKELIESYENVIKNQIQ